MRLHALLSFYDESVKTLARYAQGLADVGVDHLVAVDGRYAAFPAEAATSPIEQRGALDAACRHLGIGLTMHVPTAPWAGGEVAKRTALFAVALGVSDPGDWWAVWDSDMVAVQAPVDLHERLDASEAEAATVRIVDVVARRANRADWVPEFEMRCLFRAAPIVVGQNHYTYRHAIDGHPLWSGTDPRGLSEPLVLTDELVVEHRPLDRAPGRVLQQGQYYSRRDGEGLEMGPCARCEKRQASARVTVGLRMVNGLPAGTVNELCAECAEAQEKTNRRMLRQWGLDPAKVRFNERYSLPTVAAR